MKKKEYIDVFFFTPTFLSECPSTREPIVYAVLNVKYSISKQECFYSNSAGKQVGVNNMGNNQQQTKGAWLNILFFLLLKTYLPHQFAWGENGDKDT